MASDSKAASALPQPKGSDFSSPLITFEQEELINSFKQILRAELNSFGSKYNLQSKRQPVVEVTPPPPGVDQSAPHAWVGHSIRSFAAAAERANASVASRSPHRSATQESSMVDVLSRVVSRRGRLGTGSSEGQGTADGRGGSSKSINIASIQRSLKPPPDPKGGMKQAWSDRRSDKAHSNTFSVVSNDSSVACEAFVMPMSPQPSSMLQAQSSCSEQIASRVSSAEHALSLPVEVVMTSATTSAMMTSHDSDVATITEEASIRSGSESIGQVPDIQVGWLRKMSMSTIYSKTSESVWSGQTFTLQSLMTQTVSHMYFENLTVLFILANALTIGIQTDYSARNLSIEGPEAIKVINAIIAVFFGLELFMRLFAYRKLFFRMSCWRWNVLDLVVVTLQILEEIMNLFRLEESNVPSALSLIRLVRILRLIRIIRIVRLLRYMSELRTIVVSITGSMKPLCSTIVLLALVVYIVGIYFTQLTLDYRIDHPGSPGADALEEYFGSVGTTVIALFQTVTGGMEWRNMLTPLMEHISPVLALVFALYIVFTSLALMNIVTGVFVETALQCGREDKDVYMINHLKDLFGVLDGDQSGLVSWDEVEEHLDNPKLLAFFKDIDIDISEAKGLFNLLDRNCSGSIDADDFLSGCLRLRGPAKALDLQLVMLELAEQRKSFQSLLDHGAKAG